MEISFKKKSRTSSRKLWHISWYLKNNEKHSRKKRFIKPRTRGWAMKSLTKSCSREKDSHGLHIWGVQRCIFQVSDTCIFRDKLCHQGSLTLTISWHSSSLLLYVKVWLNSFLLTAIPKPTSLNISNADTKSSSSLSISGSYIRYDEGLYRFFVHYLDHCEV